MCGFVAILKVKGDTRQAREKALKMSRKIRHRGPDWSGVYSSEKAVLAHERLAIVDPLSGGQPLYSSDGKKVLAVNGEIYNHQEIRRLFAGQYEFQTGSDCEVILALYERYGTDFIDKLNGIFSFVLYDSTTDDYLIARDPIGVIPLYIGHDKDGTVYAASELKALEGQCEEYKPFPPGHYLCSMDVTANSPLTTVNFHRWYERDWMQYDGMQWATSDRKEAVQMVKEGLMAAVKRQLMSDVPYGVLLSGGLDSSVVSAIAKLYAAKRIETNDQHDELHHSGGIGCHPRCDLLYGNLRCNNRARLHSNVPFGTCHPQHGHQDGAQRRGG